MPFAAYTVTENPSAFQWVGQPTKLPLFVGYVNPHLTHGALGHHESAAEAASRPVQPF